MIRKKLNKFGAIKCEQDGYKFDSKAERKRYNELKLLKMAGEITGFAMQVPFIYEYEGEKIFKYISDFVVIHLDGSRTVEDVKGFDRKTGKFITTPLFNLKKKLIEAQHKIVIKLV
jgi:hypothetical protein